MKTLRERLLLAGSRAVLACVLSGCGGAIAAEALVVRPAALPLRAYPRVLIVPGPLDEDGRVARALRRHLRKAGHTRVQIIEGKSLRDHTASGSLPAATVVVELLVATQEFVHAQYGQHAQTTCDSLGCFQSVPAYAQDTPVMRALLQVTVRDARTMRVVHRLKLRALESSGNFEYLKQNAVESLISRLRASTEQIPELIEIDLLPVDVPNVDGAIEAAEDGDWMRARTVLEEALEHPATAALSSQQQARLHYNVGQARRATGLPGLPDRMRTAGQAYERALALDPQPARYARARATISDDLLAAAEVRAQRIQAARNFRFGGDLTRKGPQTEK